MNLILIILAVGLGFIAYSIVEKRVLNNIALGRKVLLTYAIRNDKSNDALQWTGTIQHKLKIGHQSDNFMVNLNDPIILNNSIFNEVVIRERRLGRYIGSNKVTEVHLFLPKHKLGKDKYKWDAFDQVAWFTIQLQ